MKPPGATVNVPALMVTVPGAVESFDVTPSVTARLPKSRTQASGIVKSFVSVHGPGPFGQPESCEEICAAVHAVSAPASRAKPMDPTSRRAATAAAPRIGASFRGDAGLTATAGLPSMKIDAHPAVL